MKTALSVALVSLIFTPAFAATIHVPSEEPTIQAGIDAAGPGDTVLVACGTYFEHDIAMSSGVHLRSETGTPDCVTIDAQQQGRVLYCEGVDASSTIAGLTLRNGAVANGELGGGLLCRESSPLITDCVLTQNYAGSGGGIFLHGSSPSMEDCVVTENTSGGSGGGMRSSFGSDPMLTRCVISSNHGMDGGGMWIGSDSSPVLSQCTFVDNVGDFWGGAIACQGATPILVGCTIVDNEAGWTGGGIWCSYESIAHLENTIVAFSREGGGIHCYIDSSHPSDASLVCCDVVGNAEGEYGGSLKDQTGINGNISEDPRFCDLDLQDFRLYSDSPCLPDWNDCGVLIGAHGLGCYAPAFVETGEAPRHARAVASPNPFHHGTSIQFHLQERSKATITIHDLRGRCVRTLATELAPRADANRIVWDGCNDAGDRLPTGTYFYRVDTPARVDTGKITLVE